MTIFNCDFSEENIASWGWS